ncbi:MAG TPA: hypothetical protein VK676_05265 [Steroidobacteraceae bacterium]|jgi:hypothetical protein|nr:hypothetical protein [Steroidobacteraceae bacterium]
MRDTNRFAPWWLAGLAAVALAATGAARADVTIEEQSTFDVFIIKAHGTSTEFTTADKQRRDSSFNCEGLMSLLCGNTQSGEIVRLDRDLTWSLEPKKREYRESPFMTAAQRQAAEQQVQAMMEKMKQCPAAKQTTAPGPNTSKCEMTPAKFDVKATGTHATFAGHDAKLTQIALTQSCRNNDTGDVCDFVITMDSWLSQDQIAGLDDRRAFQKAYLQKLGLADNALVQKQMRQFLAPYSDSLKQLAAKAGDMQGYPLKSAVRITFGGEHCAAAKGQGPGAAGGGAASGSNVVGDAGQAAGTAAAGSAAGTAGAAAGSAASNASGNNVASSILGPAASAFGSKLVSGMFNKKKAEAATAGTTGTTPSALPPGMMQAAEFTMETKAITAGPVPAAQFDIPPGWKLVVPSAKAQKEFTCPKS